MSDFSEEEKRQLKARLKEAYQQQRIQRTEALQNLMEALLQYEVAERYLRRCGEADILAQRMLEFTSLQLQQAEETARKTWDVQLLK